MILHKKNNKFLDFKLLYLCFLLNILKTPKLPNIQYSRSVFQFSNVYKMIIPQALHIGMLNGACLWSIKYTLVWRGSKYIVSYTFENYKTLLVLAFTHFLGNLMILYFLGLCMRAQRSSQFKCWKFMRYQPPVSVKECYGETN